MQKVVRKINTRQFPTTILSLYPYAHYITNIYRSKIIRLIRTDDLIGGLKMTEVERRPEPTTKDSRPSAIVPFG